MQRDVLIVAELAQNIEACLKLIGTSLHPVARRDESSIPFFPEKKPSHASEQTMMLPISRRIPSVPLLRKNVVDQTRMRFYLIDKEIL